MKPRRVTAPTAASPELTARPHRRSFTAADRLRVLAETDRAADTGGISAILRREGLYSSALTDWRRQRTAGAFDALTPARRGRKTTSPNPLAAEIAALQQDNARLARRLARAEAIIEVQKKWRSCWRCPWRRPGRSRWRRFRRVSATRMARPRPPGGRAGSLPSHCIPILMPRCMPRRCSVISSSALRRCSSDSAA